LNSNVVQNRTLCVRVIQPSIGFIAVSASVTIIFVLKKNYLLYLFQKWEIIK